MSVDVSVVMCTYNRAAMLADSLRSWLAVRAVPAAVEFLVVDNASTDGTRDTVAQFARDFPCRLRYAYEKNAGLSHARNRGIEEALGRIVAFVDDDIYFDSEWLQKLLGAFDRLPEIGCVGGKSIPTFEIDKPSWLTEPMLKFYGSTLSGDADRPMRFPEHPFGVNMAFRREVLAQVGGFNTDLGRIKSSLLSNEEKDMFYRVDRAGFVVFYCSEAILHHRVPAERLDRRWLLRRAYWQGISNVIFENYVERKPKRALCETLFRSIKRAVLGGSPHPARIFTYYKNFDFEDKIKLYSLLGTARQSFAEIFRRSN